MMSRLQEGRTLGYKSILWALQTLLVHKNLVGETEMKNFGLPDDSFLEDSLRTKVIL